MREGEGGQAIGREVAHVLAFAADGDPASQYAGGIRDEDDAIAGLGERAELPLDADIEPGLLFRLADGGLLETLTGVDEAGGEGPGAPVRVPGALHEEELAVARGENADGYLGVVEGDQVAAGAGALSPAFVCPATQLRAAGGAISRRHDRITLARWAVSRPPLHLLLQCVCRVARGPPL